MLHRRIRLYLKSPQLSGRCPRILSILSTPSLPVGGIASECRDEVLIPSQRALANLLDTSFLASMIPEEGNPPLFTIAICERRRFGGMHIFENPVSLTPEGLSKLSAATSAKSTYICASPDKSDNWVAWGIGATRIRHNRSTPTGGELRCLALAVTGTGELSLTLWFEQVFEYSRGHGTVFDGLPLSFSNIRELLSEQFPPSKESDPVTRMHVGHLCMLAASMKGHGRGGALVVLPSKATSGIDFSYAISEGSVASTSIALEHRVRSNASTQAKEGSGTPDGWHLNFRMDSTDLETHLIGQLTGVDGVTAISSDMTLLGFGGKVAISNELPDQETTHIDPRTGSRQTVRIGDIFQGMRHRSAFAACLSNGPGSIAIILSQDGYYTLIVHQMDGIAVIKPIRRLGPL